MELRALGSRSQSLRFNPEKEEEVAAILEAAVKLNASGSNIHVTVNPAGPVTPDCKTRALKDAKIVAATATFIDADECGIADKLPDNVSVKPDLAVITGLLPFIRAHFYWLLKTPVSDLERWRMFQQEMAERYGTDPAVCNPSRVMAARFRDTPKCSQAKKGYVSEMVQLQSFRWRRVMIKFEDLVRAMRLRLFLEQLLGIFLLAPPQQTSIPPKRLDVSKSMADIQANVRWHDNALRMVALWVHGGLTDEEILARAGEFQCEGYFLSRP